MEWIKAIWLEEGEEMEGVFPSFWLEENEEGEKFLRWPPKSLQADAIAKRKSPSTNWSTFKIIRIKFQDSKLLFSSLNFCLPIIERFLLN